MGKYPPKYVVAFADHLANSTDISTESFDRVYAKNYPESLGFSMETKQQEKFELSITAEDNARILAHFRIPALT